MEGEMEGWRDGGCRAIEARDKLGKNPLQCSSMDFCTSGARHRIGSQRTSEDFFACLSTYLCALRGIGSRLGGFWEGNENRGFSIGLYMYVQIVKKY